MNSVDSRKGIIDYIPGDPLPTTQNMASLIRSNLATNFGHYGAALASQSLSVKYCNPNTGMLIVRAAREQLEIVWAAITFSGGEGRVMKVIHVAGTIRSAQKAAIKHAEKTLRRRLNETLNNAERKKINDVIETCKKAIKVIDA